MNNEEATLLSLFFFLGGGGGGVLGLDIPVMTVAISVANYSLQRGAAMQRAAIWGLSTANHDQAAIWGLSNKLPTMIRLLHGPVSKLISQGVHFFYNTNLPYKSAVVSHTVFHERT